ncbi:MAG: hypothetical protein IPL46_12025 [Saprospiraceae bacterium]|nr:hypothetical protein [Saprospiraceae bacterium]
MGGNISFHYFISLSFGGAFISAAVIYTNTVVDLISGSLDRIYRFAICQHNNWAVLNQNRPKIEEARLTEEPSLGHAVVN